MSRRAPLRAISRWSRPTHRKAKAPSRPVDHDAGPQVSRLIPPTEAHTHLTREQVHELNRVLCIPVVIDTSGWLRDEMELSFIRVITGISPTNLRIGPDALAVDVQAIGNAFDLCDRYNRVLTRALLLSPDGVCQEIALRQHDQMGNRTVAIRTLLRETQRLEQQIKEMTACS
jgi:hypothetical protein